MSYESLQRTLCSENWQVSHLKMKNATMFIVLVAMMELTVSELASTKTDMIQDPQDVKANPGENVDFLCVFSAIPAYCAWTHDDLIIAASPGGHVSSIGDWPTGGNCSIRINTLTIQDNGNYQCAFPETTPGSAVTSRIAKLTILQKPGNPEIIDYTLGAELILQGNDNKITCTAKDGNPEASITWLLDGEELEGNNSVVDGITEPLLTAISELTLIPEEEYDYKELYCNADHDAYEQTESTFVVLRIAKPVTNATASFEGTSDTNATFPIGSTATMICIADGYPSPQYSWLKENKTSLDWPIVATKQNITETASEESRYICVSGNSENTEVIMSNILTVTVSDYLAVTEQPQDSTVRLGEDVKLNSVYSGGVRLCDWYKDGTLLSPEDYIFIGDEGVGNCNMVIPNVQIKQDGRYLCYAAQVETDEATVTVLQAPKSPVLIYKGNEVPENSIINEPIGKWSISCKAEDGHPVADIKWTLNDVDNEGRDVIYPNAENPKLVTITGTVDVELTAEQPTVIVICRSHHPGYSTPGFKDTTVTFDSSEPVKYV